MQKKKKKKIWVDKGSDFYNRSIKSWLKTDIKMHSVNDEEKSVVVEKFIRNLKNKIYKQISSILKNVHIDEVGDIVNEYNYTYHRTVKIKPADVKDDTYIDFDKEVIGKDPKFQFGDHVRILKCKNIFAEGLLPIAHKKFLQSVKLQTQYHGHMLLMILTVKRLLAHFMKKNCKETIKKNLGQKKGNKLYVKWKGYNNSLNSWIDKKDIVK